MSIFLSILLILLSVTFRKSKVIAVLFFGFMWTLWGWNSWNGDYDAYKLEYMDSVWDSKTKSYEAGYSKMNSFFISLGLDFQSYMILVSFIVLAIVLFFALKYAKYPALFSGMYFLIFIIEYVFTRNYLVHSIMLLAFLLVLYKVKYFRVYYVLIVLLMTTIHATAIIFLVFLVAFLTDKVFNLRKALYLFSILVLLSVSLFSQLLFPLLGEQYLVKLGLYTTGGGFSTIFFAHIAIVLLVYYYYSIIFNSNANIPSAQRRIFTIVVNVNIISLSFLSLYYYVPYFARILRFIFTFDLVFLLSSFYYINFNKLRTKLILIISLIYLAVIIMFLKSTLSLTFYPLYKSNLIWGEEYYVPDFDYDK